MKIKSLVLGILITNILLMSTIAYAGEASTKNSTNTNVISNSDVKKIEFAYGSEVNLSSVKNLNNIDELGFYGNHIEDVKILIKLKNLKKLHFGRYNSFGNYKYGIFPKGILTGLPNLRDLYIADDKEMEDSNEFRALKNLEELTLYNVKLKDFSSVFSLKKLKKLEIHTPGGVTVNKNLKEIKNLKNLEELILYDGSLKQKNIPKGIFNELTKLRKLEIGEIKAERFSDLGELKNLESLTLSDVELKDYSDVFNLKKLKKLEIDSSNNVTLAKSLNEIKNLKNLEELDLDVSGLKSADIKSLEQLKKLKKLHLDRSSDYSNNDLILSKGILKELTNLRELELSLVELENSIDLAYLKNLESLNMQGLKDFSAICSLKNLKKLEIHNVGYEGPIINLKGLKNLKNLEELNLYDYGLTENDIKFLKSMPNIIYGNIL